MNTWDERMAARRVRQPELTLVTTLFRVQGATRRPLRCALYRVDPGFELRLEYEDREGDLLQSKLFRVRDDDAVATLADQWHAALRDKGFWELPLG